MATRKIWHEILFNASASKVYEAATDTKKLAHWWTTDTRGESQIGKKLEFWFGGMCQPMEVMALKPGELVGWHAKEGGAPGWANTQIEFKIFRDQEKTFLHFRHSNWWPVSTNSFILSRKIAQPIEQCGNRFAS